MSKSVGIIKKASFYLHTRALVMLYYSLVYPYMQYCILVWGSTYPSNLNRIVLLQKRLIRIVYKASYDAHTQPFFKELGILPFDKIYLFHLGKFMYQFHCRWLPHNFENFFQNINQVHNYYTRNSSYTFFLSVEQILDNFLSATKALNSLTLSLRISVKLHPFLAFGKNLKNIFLIFNILSSKSLTPNFYNSVHYTYKYIILVKSLFLTLHVMNN
jgi:hypothetical protein